MQITTWEGVSEERKIQKFSCFITEDNWRQMQKEINSDE